MTKDGPVTCVSKEKLLSALDELRSEIANSGSGHNLRIPVNYYWEIPYELRYDTYEVDGDLLTLGDLSEDVERVEQVAGGVFPMERNARFSLCRVLFALVSMGGEESG